MGYNRVDVQSFWLGLAFIAVLVGLAKLIWEYPMESIWVVVTAMVAGVVVMVGAAIWHSLPRQQRQNPPVAQ